VVLELELKDEELDDEEEDEDEEDNVLKAEEKLLVTFAVESSRGLNIKIMAHPGASSNASKNRALYGELQVVAAIINKKTLWARKARVQISPTANI